MSAEIKAGDHFLPKGVKALEALVRIDSADADVVRFYPEGGGAVRQGPRDGFLERFEAVDRAMLDSLRIFRKELVAIDDEEGTPAWLDGRLWNGFVQPAFERDAVERLIETQFPEDGERGAVLFADGDAFVLVESACGETIPEFDRQEVLRILGEGTGTKEMRMTDPDGEEFEVYLNRIEPFTIQAEGRRIPVYAIGNGWTWSVCDPSPAPAP